MMQILYFDYIDIYYATTIAPNPKTKKKTINIRRTVLMNINIVVKMYNKFICHCHP